MANAHSELRSRLRLVLRRLIATPLHPQWLVARRGLQRLQWVGARASGAVLDIGCADRAVRHSLLQAESYLGVDYPVTVSSMYQTRPDVFTNARRLPFQDGIFHSVLLLDVLEHLREPQISLLEAARVLRPGGSLIITVPFAYPMHDQPHDYQRLTVHGLTHALESTGLAIEEIEEVGTGPETALSNFCIVMAQGAIDSILRPNWKILLAVPLAVGLIPLANGLGWVLSFLMPVKGLWPGAYYVRAIRRP